VRLFYCSRLSLAPINATWYRTIATKHLNTALQTAHTPTVTTRFNPGKMASTPFEILYLAENHAVGLYEAGVMYGPLDRPVSNPHQTKILTIDVHVRLQSIADLT